MRKGGFADLQRALKVHHVQMRPGQIEPQGVRAIFVAILVQVAIPVLNSRKASPHSPKKRRLEDAKS